jgi:hypothetical protein
MMMPACVLQARRAAATGNRRVTVCNRTENRFKRQRWVPLSVPSLRRRVCSFVRESLNRVSVLSLLLRDLLVHRNLRKNRVRNELLFMCV